MSSKNRYDGLDPEVVFQVRRKASSLIGYCGLRNHDVEDLEQILLVHVLTEIPGHNPDRCRREVFIQRSLKDCVSDIVRRLRAAKRGHDVWKDSLDEDPQGSVQLKCGEVSVSHHLESSRLKDVQDAFANLPLTQLERNLCGLLQTHSLTRAAQSLGISRWRGREMLRSVREKWEKENNENFPPISQGTAGESI